MLMNTCKKSSTDLMTPKKKRRYRDQCASGVQIPSSLLPLIFCFTMKSFVTPLAVVAFVASTVSAQTFTINSLYAR